MAGIYIHIPFCKQACHYCNFHFSTSQKNKNDFVSALLKEVEKRYAYIEREPISTIYFGGGTPSIIPSIQINEILQQLKTYFDIQPDAEITFEVNPDNINQTSLAEWRMIGINRLSIGIQTFSDHILKWMNRAHLGADSLSGFKLARSHGFDNISIDLIFGTPLTTPAIWKRDLELAMELHPDHISCYALTVEPRTALHKMIETKQTPQVDDGIQAEQFEMLLTEMEKNGYRHYEISNFALPGRESRHNSAYWKGNKYLGLGPSAHSFDGISRQWNVANNAKYIHAIQTDDVFFEKEELTVVQRLNEYIMVSVRTDEGIDTDYLQSIFGQSAYNVLLATARKPITDGNMQMTGHTLKLTKKGKFLADGIAASLFFDDPMPLAVQS